MFAPTAPTRDDRVGPRSVGPTPEPGRGPATAQSGSPAPGGLDRRGDGGTVHGSPGRGGWARAIHQTLRAQGSSSQRERSRDRVEAQACDDLTYRVGAADAPRLLGLLHAGVSGGEGLIGNMAFEGAQAGGLHKTVRQTCKNLTSHHVLTLLSAPSLSDSNFPEAAYVGRGRVGKDRFGLVDIPALQPPRLLAGASLHARPFAVTARAARMTSRTEALCTRCKACWGDYAAYGQPHAAAGHDPGHRHRRLKGEDPRDRRDRAPHLPVGQTLHADPDGGRGTRTGRGLDL